MNNVFPIIPPSSLGQKKTTFQKPMSPKRSLSTQFSRNPGTGFWPALFWVGFWRGNVPVAREFHPRAVQIHAPPDSKSKGYPFRYLAKSLIFEGFYRLYPMILEFWDHFWAWFLEFLYLAARFRGSKRGRSTNFQWMSCTYAGFRKTFKKNWDQDLEMFFRVWKKIKCFCKNVEGF